ncbi:MAG: D-beta-D-heptose 7-phosphate kinase / D-beta-D-heptose 1-phosphate adenosyltransferase [Frankiaceae bacterium]|jgi:D-beta-D-heptose 7-phosphate kinase/D-beta-D-heptose 1-phosphate adenosyltransferase|nr:D-beta-D-heptose 7-phosphate kinase / D-beta-D-heptose 1-phosphate adenosyltransferase [Frankiaceae bacterium]MDQ1648824.1 D-beta-D-heptose 7-phosphate kinase / D-beta-D-heptose 1-phosphate adenosyltransferase [Frankiaceae bacterium]
MTPVQSSMNPFDVVERLSELSVLVLGEPILDGWLSGSSLRLSREAPVQVVDVDDTQLLPGGAANTAVNLASLGAEVRLLGAVGDDADGALLLAALRDRRIRNDDLLVVPGRRTLAKRRVLAGEQMLLRYDEGDAGALPVAAEQEFLDRLARIYPLVDVVVVSDYDCGLLGPRVRSAVARLQRQCPAVLVVDARDPGRWREVGAVAVKPNAGEVARLLGRALPTDGRVETVEAAAAELLERSGAELVAATLDVDGGVLLERGRPAYRLWARPTAASQAAGAGDSFTAALALALGAGADAVVAGEIATAAAGVVCGRAATVACSADELRAALLQGAAGGDVVLDLNRLGAVVRAHRLRGRRVIVTNGVFDVLHRGHVTYLNQAKALGDVLVVGLNSDDSVRRLKGSDRPLNPSEDRAAVLSGLSCVDHVVVFEGDTSVDVLDVVRPDVYVKGGDYTAEMLPEAPHVESIGGEIVILPYLEDRSTTGLVRRIRGGGTVDTHS